MLLKEQKAKLLPLLPATLVQSLSSALLTSKGTVMDGVPQYSNKEMFTKKRKNTKSTPAQNYW